MITGYGTVDDAIREAREMQANGLYINGTIFHMMADEIERLRKIEPQTPKPRMVERVAQAIVNEPYKSSDNYQERLARAAIAAMREPTDEMIYAAGPARFHAEALLGSGGSEPICVAEWRAMIKAALK